MTIPAGPRPSSGGELKVQLEAERHGEPFLIYRDDGGAQRLLELGSLSPSLTIGRRESSDIPVPWDTEVSRTHAELLRVGGDWALVDDGLSRNGSWVNGERLHGRRRLRDGDVIRVGNTSLLFRNPGEPNASTAVARGRQVAELTETQRRVLVALFRPFGPGAEFPRPATNQEIADEVFLSVDAIKAHLRVLFQKYGIDHLPPNQKRLALVDRALHTGAVSYRDL